VFGYSVAGYFDSKYVALNYNKYKIVIFVSDAEDTLGAMLAAIAASFTVFAYVTSYYSISILTPLLAPR
jgi:hypothetical protein